MVPAGSAAPGRLGRDQEVVVLVAANPEPQKPIGLFDSESAVPDGDAGGPDLPALALTDFFELQGAVPRVGLEQCELLVSAPADVFRQD